MKTREEILSRICYLVDQSDGDEERVMFALRELVWCLT